MRIFVRLALAAALCGTAACELEDGGANSGTGPTGQDVTVDIPSTAALDGWVRSTGDFAITGSPITGDLDAAVPGIGYRQFYSFDLSALPAGATIVSATLRLYQSTTVGSPYAKLGNVVVEHVDYGDALGPAGYSAVPLEGGAPPVISSDASVGPKTTGVATAVTNDLTAGRIHAQFRLRFSNTDANNDGVSDFAQFNDAEAPLNRPILSVTYH